MNSINAIGESQVLSTFLINHGSLSHKEELESQNRSERRIFERISRGLNAKQRAALRYKRARRFQFWKNIEKFLKSLTPLRQRIMDEFLKFGQAFNFITASSITIAQRIGCCRDTVQEVLKELRRSGLLVLNRRRRNNSSIKRLHPDFFNVNLKMRLWKQFDAYRLYFEKANRYLKLWILFQKEPTLELSIFNPSIFTKDDIQVYEDIHIHSREVYASEVNPEAKATSTREVPMENLSQKIADMKQQLEPERAAQKALKADAARDLSDLLKGRVTATIHLSAKGQFHMLRYCDGAMLYGLECLSKYGTIDNRTNYRLFESACIEYSKKNEIKVDAEKYDKLLKDMGYFESQPFCNKITLDEPLSKSKALTKAAERVELAKPITPARPTERSRYASLDPSFKDPIIALALRLGYEDALNLPQISNETVDLKE